MKKTLKFDNIFNNVQGRFNNRGTFWPEPVEAKKVDKRSVGIHIIGSTLYSKSHIDQIIPNDELSKLKHREFPLTVDSAPLEFFLALEGLRYHYASLFDPFLAMNVSQIDPLPFQIDAVYGYVLVIPNVKSHFITVLPLKIEDTF
ncbi:MAG: hypothetical protein RMI01_09235 [Thermodesulfovibrio sp.]|nr:hypothetical protein [Thermodesulfovibrio sp.]